jgi:hypothetical protein
VLAEHLLGCERPYKRSCFWANGLKPAREVADPDSSNHPHARVGRGAAEADTPALNKRTIVVVQA